MPFALTFIGIMLIVTGFQNTYQQFGSLVIKDFTGPGNFLYWLIAIGIIGALGYNKTFQVPSRLLMTLVILGMFINKKYGVFNLFLQQIASGSTSLPKQVGAPLTASGSTSLPKQVGAPLTASGGSATSSSSSSGGFDLSNIGQDIQLGAEILSFVL